MLPLSRVVPPLYQFRVRSRVFRWYAQLRDVETQLENGRRPHREALADRARRPRPPPSTRWPCHCPMPTSSMRCATTSPRCASACRRQRRQARCRRRREGARGPDLKNLIFTPAFTPALSCGHPTDAGREGGVAAGAGADGVRRPITGGVHAAVGGAAVRALYTHAGAVGDDGTAGGGDFGGDVDDALVVAVDGHLDLFGLRQRDAARRLNRRTLTVFMRHSFARPPRAGQLGVGWRPL